MNVDPAEVEKFDDLADQWWDPTGPMRPLHEMNPVRVGFIADRTSLRDARVLDVGCGAGLLAEGLARQGATMTAADQAPGPLAVARAHAAAEQLEIDYRQQDVSEFAANGETFDVVTCLEVLEHAPDPAELIRSCAALLKPGGDLFLSTINRTPRAWALTILGAEYVLGLIPRGTHDYARFLRPSELGTAVRAAGLRVIEVRGMQYQPLARRWRLAADCSVNYLLHARRADD